MRTSKSKTISRWSFLIDDLRLPYPSHTMKKAPTGFIATCRCGAAVAALDYDRADHRHASQQLGQWLADGRTVTPQFDDNFSITLSKCSCETAEKN